MTHYFYSGDHNNFVVPATFYQAPYGSPVDEHLPIREDACKKADEIINAGFVFECEILRTNQFSITITSTESDHAFVLVNPGVNALYEAIEKLSDVILEFNIAEELKMVESYKNDMMDYLD